ncbi:lysophospholipid acyltransferase family protein [Sagittula sp. NFXS13]|uniref:Putative hemolysin n=1 Tax=Sagittula marina TaxID=943940 RepID=A0A7W6DPN8_9RHOB|nr:lysophospholipid acyltransferase family protein [Sagittula marina]MBB3986647.1 putative hemolysin [Sagittula marina]
MKDRIDPLIEERAPWFNRDTVAVAAWRRILERLLQYQRTLDVAGELEHISAQDGFRLLGDIIYRDVQITGLDNIPRQGPALIVSNHPTGLADGVMLYNALADIRPDAYFFANKDVVRVLPQLDDIVCPVEWRKEQRSHAKTRETMAYCRDAVEKGRLGVIFPSGRLAKRRGLSLHERPWMASAAMIARKLDLPVIPVNIRARNSAMFYLFDILHPTLRDISLFHETLNKARQPFRITIGEPISPSALPAKSEEGIEMLRRATLALGGPKAPAVSLLDATRRPSWRKA